MRALVYQEDGLVFDPHYPEPAPVEGEALIRVVLVGICNTDLEIVRGYMGFRGVLGHEFVGVVEEIYGAHAQERYKSFIGKRVVGDINAACYQADCLYCQRGMTTHCPRRTTLGIVQRDGAFAEYLMLPAQNLHMVPENVSDEQAVFVEPLAANFEMLEQLHLRPTMQVMILGDGKMGQLAAQVLALTGCELSMLGKNPDKLALAEKHGVRTQLLNTIEDFSAKHEERVDVVVECSGSAKGIEMALRLAKPRGTIILKSTVADKSTLDLAPIVIDEIRVQGSRCGPFEPALRALKQKLVDVKPLISATYALDDGLSAFQHAEQKGVLKVLMQI